VSWLELEVTRPDVVVYLQAGTDTLLERVAKRGRPFERDMDRDYMQALNEAYNYFFFHYAEAPTLIVNTNGIDFVKNRADLEDLEARILAHREGTVYYTPMPSKDRRRLLLDAAHADEPEPEPATTPPPPADPVAVAAPEKPTKRPRAKRATRAGSPVKGRR
jgi:hypothetical protein